MQNCHDCNFEQSIIYCDTCKINLCSKCNTTKHIKNRPFLENSKKKSKILHNFFLICEECENSKRTCFCEDCEEKFCEKCFLKMHKKGKRKNHKKKILEKYEKFYLLAHVIFIDNENTDYFKLDKLIKIYKLFFKHFLKYIFIITFDKKKLLLQKLNLCEFFIQEVDLDILKKNQKLKIFLDDLFSKYNIDFFYYFGKEKNIIFYLKNKNVYFKTENNLIFTDYNFEKTSKRSKSLQKNNILLNIKNINSLKKITEIKKLSKIEINKKITLSNLLEKSSNTILLKNLKHPIYHIYNDLEFSDPLLKKYILIIQKELHNLALKGFLKINYEKFFISFQKKFEISFNNLYFLFKKANENNIINKIIRNFSINKQLIFISLKCSFLFSHENFLWIILSLKNQNISFSIKMILNRIKEVFELEFDEFFFYNYLEDFMKLKNKVKSLKINLFNNLIVKTDQKNFFIIEYYDEIFDKEKNEIKKIKFDCFEDEIFFKEESVEFQIFLNWIVEIFNDNLMRIDEDIISNNLDDISNPLEKQFYEQKTENNLGKFSESEKNSGNYLKSILSKNDIKSIEDSVYENYIKNNQIYENNIIEKNEKRNNNKNLDNINEEIKYENKNILYKKEEIKKDKNSTTKNSSIKNKKDSNSYLININDNEKIKKEEKKNSYLKNKKDSTLNLINFNEIPLLDKTKSFKKSFKVIPGGKYVFSLFTKYFCNGELKKFSLGKIISLVNSAVKYEALKYYKTFIFKNEDYFENLKNNKKNWKKKNFLLKRFKFVLENILKKSEKSINLAQLKNIIEKNSDLKIDDFEKFGISKLKTIIEKFSSIFLLEEHSPGNIYIKLKGKYYKEKNLKKSKKNKKKKKLKKFSKLSFGKEELNNNNKMRLNVSTIDGYLKKIKILIFRIISKSNFGIELSQLEKKLNEEIKSDFDYLTFGYESFYLFLMKNLSDFIEIEVKYINQFERKFIIYIKNNKFGIKKKNRYRKNSINSSVMSNNQFSSKEDLNRLITNLIKNNSYQKNKLSNISINLNQILTQEKKKFYSSALNRKKQPNSIISNEENLLSSLKEDIPSFVSKNLMSQIGHLKVEDNISCGEIGEIVNFIDDCLEKGGKEDGVLGDKEKK